MFTTGKKNLWVLWEKKRVVAAESMTWSTEKFDSKIEASMP